MSTVTQNNISLIKEIIIEAGNSIMSVYNSMDFAVENKADNSPVTIAYTQSHEFIESSLLKAFKDIPVVSEEGLLPVKSKLSLINSSELYWLIDPLDGTKGFINHTDDFCINIALIKDGISVLGFIYLPVTQQLFFAIQNQGCFVENFIDHSITKLVNKKTQKSTKKCFLSRFHCQEEIEYLKNHFNNITWEFNHYNSALKFCLFALGEADLLLRFGATSLWDTAAGSCIISELQANFINISTGSQLNYTGVDSLINPPFYVCHSGWFVYK